MVPSPKYELSMQSFAQHSATKHSLGSGNEIPVSTVASCRDPVNKCSALVKNQRFDKPILSVASRFRYV